MLTNLGLFSLIPIFIIGGYLWLAIRQSRKGKLEFTHPDREVVRIAPIGFSWTTLIFGGFPALFRGHFLAAVAIFITTIVTSGLAALVFPFFYNKWYVKSLVKKGYLVSSVQGDFSIISSGFKYDLPTMKA